MLSRYVIWQVESGLLKKNLSAYIKAIRCIMTVWMIHIFFIGFCFNLPYLKKKKYAREQQKDVGCSKEVLYSF